MNEQNGQNQNNNITEYNPGNADNDNNQNNNQNIVVAAPVRKINLPNKLTIFRIILVPVIMIFILITNLGDEKTWIDTWSNIFAAALFLIATLTDLLDGIIARRLKLITDFGKLMDPLADKFLIVGSLIAITGANSFDDPVFRVIAVWVTAIVFFRELAVTSLRLVANTSDGNVIAANFAGKLKTFSQCVCVMTILLEDVVLSQNLSTPPYLFSYITMAIMLILTVYSGFVYFKSYWSYINPAK